MTDLQRARHIHVIGAGGSGMSGLAKLLAQRGRRVSGSDLKPSIYLDGLGDLGVATWVGHRPDLAADWDLVVISSAVPSTDPEVVAATAAGVPVWERPRLLAELTAAQPAIGVAGTHGKTTSTAMLVAALRAIGRDPGFLVGGELADLNTNAHLGDPELFVIEADEAFGTFLHLHLAGLTVTNIEADHLDHYVTVGALEEAFVTVAAAVTGPLVVNLDDPATRRLAARTDAVGYGISPDAVWSMQQIEPGADSVRFQLVGPSAAAAAVEIPRPGLHNARNAAGVLALIGELGLDPVAAAAGLKDFGGVRRRFEVRGRIGGVTVVDDYAHHPTEVATTLAAARLGSWNTVWAVFQPHRYSRTAEQASSFGPALAAADRVVVTDVYPAGEAPQPGVTGRLVADAARAAGAAAVHYEERRADLASFLAAQAAPGDLILLMGAGDITTVADELAELLEVGA